MSHMMHHSIRHAARIRFIQISIVINNYLPLRNGVEKRHGRINVSTSTLPAIIAETTEHIAIWTWRTALGISNWLRWHMVTKKNKRWTMRQAAEHAALVWRYFLCRWLWTENGRDPGGFWYTYHRAGPAWQYSMRLECINYLICCLGMKLWTT